MILAAVAVFALALPEIIGITTTAQTNPATESFSCTTGPAQTSCALTLASPNYKASMAQVVVTETSPSSAVRTAASSISASRLVVTVTGLATSTGYNFSVAYLTAEPDISTPLALYLDNMTLLVPALLGVLIAFALAAVLLPRSKAKIEAG
jgi:hypothetical protein